MVEIQQPAVASRSLPGIRLVTRRSGRLGSKASLSDRFRSRWCVAAVGRARPAPRSYVRPLSNALRALSTQWPWAPYGSGMQVAKPGHRRRSPRLDRRSASVTVDDVVPKINDWQVVSSPARPFACLARTHEAGRTGVPYRLGAREFTVSATQRRRSPGNPHGCWTSYSEIYRQPGNRPDGRFPPGTQRDNFTVRFTVRLKGIPAIDLDRHPGRHLPVRINALGPLFDRPR